MNRRILHLTSSEIALSLLMFTGGIKGIVLHWGTIFPASGTERSLALYSSGTTELLVAKKLYSNAQDRLKCPIQHRFDSPHAPWWVYLPVTTSSAGRCTAVGRSNPEAEQLARDALASAVRAFNLLEDFPEADDAHRMIHGIGMFVSRHFGCEIRLKDEVWHWSCPTIIAHLRFGKSAGFTAKRICSICGEGLDQCPHMPGQTYKVAVGDIAYCPCGSQNCTRHQKGSIIEVSPHGIINEANLEEVSWVARPRDPLARIQAIEYTTEQISSLMGGARIPPDVQAVECFHCRQSCTGLWKFETLGVLLERQ